jgi:hypothetical protein
MDRRRSGDGRSRPRSPDQRSGTNVIKGDRTTATADTAAAGEIATLRQKLAAAEARIREIEDKDNAFKPLTSWKSDKTKSTPTLDDLRECMAALNCEIAKRSG